MKKNLFLIPILILNLCLYNCSKEPYLPPHESNYGVYTIIDPDETIELYIWETTGLGNLPKRPSDKIIKIIENENIIFQDTINTDYLNTGLLPEIGKNYSIKVSDLENKIKPFESRQINNYYPPAIISYSANDSVGSLGPGYQQTLSQIEIIIDQTINNSPYYGYEIIVDSLPFQDEKPINITSNWFRRTGYNCPEIAEVPYLDKNLGIINLTCFQEENLFSIESSGFRPGEFEKVHFTLCNFDKHTMDFARWMFQNLTMQADFKITQIFSTKDDFANESGYDFTLNRSCKKFILEFN